ncbi:Holliday junction resolvase RuvX [Cellulomonas soli]|uniref:Putative pre-16S rRNA nuclease n=1 Tax=Cellulomonas soli TaxID=931535 RepID=A0A512PA69_9CELL|nr:Holliday junction resolvase RuvX [Cellulomonas soli]NYI60590.1 putative Holliday junction resolvase [Cellulomonas soli]GEP68105.1 putative pre-16S rRNA nuclease [Cellulomonas soli]
MTTPRDHVADRDEEVTRGSRLAVDVGTVRVGLAASDPDGLVATPVETLARVKASNARPVPSDVLRIVDEVHERGAALVYVGLPRHLSGAEGASSAGARAYAVLLAQAVAPVPVRLVDERMSTVSAHQALYASGRSGRRHRQVVDQAAAVVILQSALDAERASGRRPGERVDVDPQHARPVRGGAAGARTHDGTHDAGETST